MAFICSIKVVPSSGRNKWVLEKSGTIKCFLKSPPEKGKANRELITLISKSLSIPKGSVSILSGLTSRKKRVMVDHNVSLENFFEVLGLEKQEKIF